MKYRKITATVVFFVLCGSINVLAKKDIGPEMMNLKERFKVEGKKKAVIFPHHKHQAKLKCEQCHVSADGGGDLRFKIVKKDGIQNDYHKKFCFPCHTEMKVPKGRSCSNCHNE